MRVLFLNRQSLNRVLSWRVANVSDRSSSYELNLTDVPMKKI